MRMTSIDWSIVDQMIDLADSDDAKKMLKDRATRLHHKEEWEAGIL